MNLTQHTELWSKVEKFTFDEKGATVKFSHKLAQQQDWSATFTARVIEEYRRFIFLCCISPNGASPSQIVDEAWHLHLTYTQSYWTDFCKHTLNKDIHHHPSKGGDEENHKHQEWYKETLILYETVFGGRPPTDIWPPPPMDDEELPEPRSRIRSKTFVLILAILLAPFVISFTLFYTFFPFSLTGPQFLLFYLLLIAAGLGALVLYEWEKSRGINEIVDACFPSDLSVFQAALFFNDKHRAVQTAIIDLIRRHMLVISNGTKFMVKKTGHEPAANEQNPLVTELLNEPDNEVVSYDMIAYHWYNDTKAGHPALNKLQQFASLGEPKHRKYFILLLVLLVGVIRMMQGIYNDKPVLFLFLEMLLLGIMTFVIGQWVSRKAFVLRRAKEIYQQQEKNTVLYSDDVVASFSQKGNDAIAGFAEGVLLSVIFTAGMPRSEVRAWWGSYNSGGSCSGGGGGSCSGGGCGGGCGGCGS